MNVQRNLRMTGAERAAAASALAQADLHQIGIQPGPARSTALFQLAAEVPAAILARMLGIHINVAVAWQHASNGDWAAYAAGVSRRTSQQFVASRHETQDQV